MRQFTSSIMSIHSHVENINLTGRNESNSVIIRISFSNDSQTISNTYTTTSMAKIIAKHSSAASIGEN